MTRKSINETMLSVAQEVAGSRSVCPGGNTGCVLATEDGRILAVGYNGPMHGANDRISECIRDRLDLHGGFGYEVCPCVHAESNAVAHAARHGVSLQNAVAYVTRKPCGACARLLYQAGVERYWIPGAADFELTFEAAEEARARAEDEARQIYE